MAQWIETAKRIYKDSFEGTGDARSFLMAVEDKCDEKGYSLTETKEVIDYIKA